MTAKTDTSKGAALRVRRYQTASLDDAARYIETAFPDHNPQAPRMKVYVTRARGVWTVRALSLV